MTKAIRILEFTLGTGALVAAGWTGIIFVEGFGYAHNNFMEQAASSFFMGATGAFAWWSFSASGAGITRLPSRMIQRYRSRPFARRLIDSTWGILSSTTPKMTASDELLETKGKRKGKIKKQFAAGVFPTLNETIQHESSTINITHESSGKMKATVSIPSAEGARIEEKLKKSEAALLANTINSYRTAAFARILRCETNIDTIAVNVGLRLPEGEITTGMYLLEDNPEGLSYIMMRTDTELGDGGWIDKYTSWIMHPAIGYLNIPHDIVEDTLRNQRDHRLLAAFDKTVKPAAAMPAIIGDPVAAKEISIAQKLVTRYPDMKDYSGTPITPLVTEHLPRLLRAHADATAAAMVTDHIDEAQLRRIAADLEDGLAVITRAVLEGVEQEQRRSREDLSVEIAFLKARHPEPAELSVA